MTVLTDEQRALVRVLAKQRDAFFDLVALYRELYLEVEPRTDAEFTFLAALAEYLALIDGVPPNEFFLLFESTSLGARYFAVYQSMRVAELMMEGERNSLH